MSVETGIVPTSVDFWSTSYRGHQIAAQRHYRGWLVYVNNVMQHGKLFGNEIEAAIWLRSEVNQRIVDTAAY